MPKVGLVAYGKCLTPECNNKASAQCKGLCLRCWGKAKKLIESGKTTLEELEALGMVATEQSPFEKELERRRQAAN